MRRLAFVVPAEIGHAPYAAPLLDHLAANFASVHVVAVREKFFPRLSEDCWLLFAGGAGGRAAASGCRRSNGSTPARRRRPLRTAGPRRRGHEPALREGERANLPAFDAAAMMDLRYEPRTAAE